MLTSTSIVRSCLPPRTLLFSNRDIFLESIGMEFSRKEQLGLTAQSESPSVQLHLATHLATNSRYLTKRERTGITLITVRIISSNSRTDLKRDF